MDFSDYKGIYVIAEVRDGKVEKSPGNFWDRPESWQRKREIRWKRLSWAAV